MTERAEVIRQLNKVRTKVHCLTNPVTMEVMANLCLAAGGSAIMALEPREVEEITSLCRVTLINTGVPDDRRCEAFLLAGRKANALGHPVILDPVGVGASQYRLEGIERLLEQVRPSVIRCNQSEALTLLKLRMSEEDMQRLNRDLTRAAQQKESGVESSVSLQIRQQCLAASLLAQKYGCTALVSGPVDVVSDGKTTLQVSGGDDRITRVTGSGCMLSAVCGLLAGTEITPFEAAYHAASIWKECAALAGGRVTERQEGMGSFKVYLLDAIDGICHQQ